MALAPILADIAILKVEESSRRVARREPPVTASVRPSDYDNDLSRGKVHFAPAWRNYSCHSVFIPAGTVVRNCNFSQASPNTDAISSDGPITLIDCNLCNVRLDPSWTVERCNTVQSWIVRELVDGEDRERRAFICSHPSQLTGSEVPPLNVVTRRAF